MGAGGLVWLGQLSSRPPDPRRPQYQGRGAGDSDPKGSRGPVSTQNRGPVLQDEPQPQAPAGAAEQAGFQRLLGLGPGVSSGCLLPLLEGPGAKRGDQGPPGAHPTPASVYPASRPPGASRKQLPQSPARPLPQPCGTSVAGEETGSGVSCGLVQRGCRRAPGPRPPLPKALGPRRLPPPPQAPRRAERSVTQEPREQSMRLLFTNRSHGK